MHVGLITIKVGENTKEEIEERQGERLKSWI